MPSFAGTFLIQYIFQIHERWAASYSYAGGGCVCQCVLSRILFCFRFEVPGLGQECAIRVEGTAEVVPGSRGDCPSRLKATFTSFSLLLGGQEK